MATEGPNSPASSVNDASLGFHAWTDPGNVLASDDARATVTPTGTNLSNYLFTTDYSFTIPDGSTINGVTVEVEASTAFGVSADFLARLIKGGALTGTVALFSSGENSGTDAYLDGGGASELWGATLTAAEVNDSGFGVAITARDSNGDGDTLRVDHIRLTVHYTEDAGVSTSQYNTLLRHG